jgi:hypothetical protein
MKYIFNNERFKANMHDDRVIYFEGFKSVRYYKTLYDHRRDVIRD